MVWPLGKKIGARGQKERALVGLAPGIGLRRHSGIFGERSPQGAVCVYKKGGGAKNGGKYWGKCGNGGECQSQGKKRGKKSQEKKGPEKIRGPRAKKETQRKEEAVW